MMLPSTSHDNLRLHYFLRNLFLLSPKAYQKYQDGRFQFAENVLRHNYEREYPRLPLLFDPNEPPINVVDVGSNRGQSSKVFLRIFKPTSLHMFEPLPQMVQICNESFSKYQNVKVHHVALGSHESTIQIFIPTYNSVTFWGLASDSVDNAVSMLSPSTIWNFRADKLKVESLSVPVRTLDQYHLTIDFLKIDVEGNELAVLKGGLQTLIKNQPVVLVEVSRNAKEISDIFSDMLYENLELVQGVWQKSKGTRLNQVFIPKEKATRYFKNLS